MVIDSKKLWHLQIKKIFQKLRWQLLRTVDCLIFYHPLLFEFKKLFLSNMMSSSRVLRVVWYVTIWILSFQYFLFFFLFQLIHLTWKPGIKSKQTLADDERSVSVVISLKLYGSPWSPAVYNSGIYLDELRAT